MNDFVQAGTRHERLHAGEGHGMNDFTRAAGAPPTRLPALHGTRPTAQRGPSTGAPSGDGQ